MFTPWVWLGSAVDYGVFMELRWLVMSTLLSFGATADAVVQCPKLSLTVNTWQLHIIGSLKPLDVR